MSAHRKPFQFRAATKDRGNLAQLQEWANHHRVNLAWCDQPEQVGGVTTHYSYPINHDYPSFTGSGQDLRTARGLAADKIVGAPGVLDEARSRFPPPPPPPPALLRSTR